jgi:hypothetical protein
MENHYGPMSARLDDSQQKGRVKRFEAKLFELVSSPRNTEHPGLDLGNLC